MTHAEILEIAVAEVRQRPNHYGQRSLARTLADECCCRCTLTEATTVVQCAVADGVLLAAADGGLTAP